MIEELERWIHEGGPWRFSVAVIGLTVVTFLILFGVVCAARDIYDWIEDARQRKIRSERERLRLLVSMGPQWRFQCPACRSKEVISSPGSRVRRCSGCGRRWTA